MVGALDGEWSLRNSSPTSGFPPTSDLSWETGTPRQQVLAPGFCQNFLSLSKLQEISMMSSLFSPSVGSDFGHCGLPLLLLISFPEDISPNKNLAWLILSLILAGPGETQI